MMKCAALILALLAAPAFAQRPAALDQTAVPSAQMVTDIETHLACLRHRHADGTYETGWTACTNFETAFATRQSDAQTAVANGMAARDARAQLRLALPP